MWARLNPVLASTSARRMMRCQGAKAGAVVCEDMVGTPQTLDGAVQKMPLHSIRRSRGIHCNSRTRHCIGAVSAL